MKISVIVPVFNEERTVRRVISKVLDQACVGEVIVVNDGSTDNTSRELGKVKSPKLKIFNLPQNKGKGASLSLGISKAKEGYLIFQDADLEYDPSEYKLLINNVGKNVRVVYGSRILRQNKRAYQRTYWGNVLITAFCNRLFKTKLTDSYTCYKLLPTKLAKGLKLSSSGFEVEAEITAKLANKKIKITEVPISYSPRKYEQGKKIRTKDALIGALTLLRIRFFS